ncbi:MAG: fructose-6-phosphate aldolase [candidate division Zixibacteria bacterium]|nr:fructose-6-phosphate aldolase [candidate division Zixibacteria bacterium]
MKFFIDTANLDEIKEAAALGILDGVTTNPSLLSKETMPFRELLAEICKVVSGPVSAEVVALDTAGMIHEAEDLAGIADNITIKIPCTFDGIKAIKHLSERHIMTNATLCFSPMQALMVAKAGGTFVSPFVGRLDDISHVGMDLIQQIVTIYNNYGFDTEVLVASIRNPLHVVDAALMGAHVATIPFKVIMQLIKHPLTDNGLKRFLEDWEKVNKG